MGHFGEGFNLIVLLVVIWSVLWKCYSVWTAVKRGEKWWFVALLLFNTAGILDMIYIFGVAKKKWSDIEKLISRIK